MHGLSITCRTLASIVVLIVSTVAIWPATAAAHTDFEFSEPADGTTVDGPVTQVVVGFTNPARPVGDGFQLLDPSGQVRPPSSVDPTDGTTFVLTFDPPLTAGTYGLRWRVQAGDAHPADGSFSFAVSAPVTTTAAPTTTTTAPPATTAPPPSTTADTATTAVTAATAVPPTTDADAVASSIPATTEVPPASPASAESGTSLEDFLAGGGTGNDGETLGWIGRVLSSLGLIVGLGTFAALVWVIRGERRELVMLVRVVRLSGVVVVAGGLLEFAALAASQSSAVLDLVDTRAGFAALLKVVGGLSVAAGFGRSAGRDTTVPQALSAAVAASGVTSEHETPAAAGRQRWVPTGTAWLGLAGLAVVLVSFWFDGHTVSRGPWVLHAAANSVHLVAAAVWAGGVVAMAMIVWLRRATMSTDLGPMVVRFSTPATVSLLAVIAAGLAMAAMILEEPSDLLGSDWGRRLTVKTAAVAVVAGLGAFNHFRLRPLLERRPDDPALATQLRVSLTTESAVFAVVVGLTASLVVAAI